MDTLQHFDHFDRGVFVKKLRKSARGILFLGQMWKHYLSKYKIYDIIFVLFMQKQNWENLIR